MIHIDVDTAVTVPVNVMPLTDDSDFVTRETGVAYNATGMDLVWNFVTCNGTITQTAVTPTTGGDYDWSEIGDAMYKIEIPASGGASINNDTEGVGYFTGVATGILPWRGPDILFRAAAVNDALIEGGDNLDVNAVEISGDSTAADNAESFFDGTGYAGTNNVIPSVTTVTGNVNGSVASVSGAVGSVTGNIGGNVTGSVGSVTGNVGGNVAGSVASVSGNLGGNVLGSVAGSVASVTGGINTSGGTITTLDALDTAQDTQHGTTQTYLSSNLGTNGANATEAGGTGDHLTALALSAAGVSAVQSGLATPTNITAGTITTVTNLTNAPTNGDLTATMKASVTAAVPTAAAIGTQVWSTSDRALSDPAGFKKNTAVANFMFLMVDAADHITPLTGATVTAERSIDGGAFASCSNSVSEVASGMYKISFSAADMNGDIISFKFTASGADPRYITISTET